MTRGFGWVEVAHGFTMKDLDRAARIAVYTARTAGTDVDWRYQIAWSEIAAEVWTAETPPRFSELVHAGANAVDVEMRREPHHHGYRREDGGGGVMSAASVYWWDLTQTSPSPEGGVVDRTALAQILPALPETAQATLHALAIHGRTEAAAAALGIEAKAFQARLATARSRFLALWHEGEEPSAVWRVDRRPATRVGRVETRAKERRLPPPHGVSRYGNHGCRCGICSVAFSAYEKNRRATSAGKPVRTVTVSQFAAMKVDEMAGLSRRQLAAKWGVSMSILAALFSGVRPPAQDEVVAA